MTLMSSSVPTQPSLASGTTTRLKDQKGNTMWEEKKKKKKKPTLDKKLSFVLFSSCPPFFPFCVSQCVKRPCGKGNQFVPPREAETLR